MQISVVTGWRDGEADAVVDRDVRAAGIGGLVPDLVAPVVARQPYREAVRCGMARYTYRDLDRVSAVLAGAAAASGVRAGDVVGVFLERSAVMVAAVLGVLRAGGTYLPLDPGYPTERLRFMLADSGTGVVLTEPALRSRLAELAPDVRVVTIDEPGTGGVALPVGGPPDPESGAFLLYTSGSTGVPKGVAVPHRAVVNFLTAMGERIGATDRDVFLAQAPLSFDISVFELLLPLTVGARIHLVDRATAMDGSALARAIDDGWVTVVQGTPTTHRMLVAAGWRGGAAVTVVSGGEPLPADLAAALLDRGVRLWNCYGPTETTVYTHALRMSPGDPVRLGGPLTDVRTYLLDENLRPVAPGEVGEICLAGPCLATGYLHRPALTAERFLPDPFDAAPGRRMYRSGDLARMTDAGLLDPLGRTDHQVKLRGYRVELGEVEAALRADARVRDAVVFVSGQGADATLVGCLVPEGDEPPDRDELRAALGARLPGYLVPARFTVLDRLPLTPSGKVDRAAVAASGGGRPLHPTSAAPPDTPLERVVAGVWLDLLDVPRLGVDEPVLDAGANSVTLMRAADLFEEIFGIPVAVRVLFDRPTVAEQARYLAGHGPEMAATADRLLALAQAG
ncbi:MAG TPA: non-ribosomal peptide synthetase [Pseudonocardiaceae bacterium]|nr:non-ribosomal peptide synthetase [Pseudonocardiaceae bacterium]